MKLITKRKGVSRSRSDSGVSSDSTRSLANVDRKEELVSQALKDNMKAVENPKHVEESNDGTLSNEDKFNPKFHSESDLAEKELFLSNFKIGSTSKVAAIKMRKSDNIGKEIGAVIRPSKRSSLPEPLTETSDYKFSKCKLQNKDIWNQLMCISKPTRSKSMNPNGNQSTRKRVRRRVVNDDTNRSNTSKVNEKMPKEKKIVRTDQKLNCQSTKSNLDSHRVTSTSSICSPNTRKQTNKNNSVEVFGNTQVNETGEILLERVSCTDTNVEKNERNIEMSFNQCDTNRDVTEKTTGNQLQSSSNNTFTKANESETKKMGNAINNKDQKNKTDDKLKLTQDTNLNDEITSGSENSGEESIDKKSRRRLDFIEIKKIRTSPRKRKISEATTVTSIENYNEISTKSKKKSKKSQVISDTTNKSQMDNNVTPSNSTENLEASINSNNQTNCLKNIKLTKKSPVKNKLIDSNITKETKNKQEDLEQTNSETNMIMSKKKIFVTNIVQEKVTKTNEKNIKRCTKKKRLDSNVEEIKVNDSEFNKNLDASIDLNEMRDELNSPKSKKTKLDNLQNALKCSEGNVSVSTCKEKLLVKNHKIKSPKKDQSVALETGKTHLMQDVEQMNDSSEICSLKSRNTEPENLKKSLKCFEANVSTHNSPSFLSEENQSKTLHEINSENTLVAQDSEQTNCGSTIMNVSPKSLPESNSDSVHREPELSKNQTIQEIRDKYSKLLNCNISPTVHINRLVEFTTNQWQRKNSNSISSSEQTEMYVKPELESLDSNLDISNNSLDDIKTEETVTENVINLNQEKEQKKKIILNRKWDLHETNQRTKNNFLYNINIKLASITSRNVVFSEAQLAEGISDTSAVELPLTSSNDGLGNISSEIKANLSTSEKSQKETVKTSDTKVRSKSLKNIISESTHELNKDKTKPAKNLKSNKKYMDTECTGKHNKIKERQSISKEKVINSATVEKSSSELKNKLKKVETSLKDISGEHKTKKFSGHDKLEQKRTPVKKIPTDSDKMNSSNSKIQVKSPEKLLTDKINSDTDKEFKELHKRNAKIKSNSVKESSEHKKTHSAKETNEHHKIIEKNKILVDKESKEHHNKSETKPHIEKESNEQHKKVDKIKTHSDKETNEHNKKLVNIKPHVHKDSKEHHNEKKINKYHNKIDKTNTIKERNEHSSAKLNILSKVNKPETVTREDDKNKTNEKLSFTDNVTLSNRDSADKTVLVVKSKMSNKKQTPMENVDNIALQLESLFAVDNNVRRDYTFKIAPEKNNKEKASVKLHDTDSKRITENMHEHINIINEHVSKNTEQELLKENINEQKQNDETMLENVKILHEKINITEKCEESNENIKHSPMDCASSTTSSSLYQKPKHVFKFLGRSNIKRPPSRMCSKIKLNRPRFDSFKVPHSPMSQSIRSDLSPRFSPVVDSNRSFISEISLNVSPKKGDREIDLISLYAETIGIESVTDTGSVINDSYCDEMKDDLFRTLPEATETIKHTNVNEWVENTLKICEKHKLENPNDSPTALLSGQMLPKIEESLKEMQQNEILIKQSVNSKKVENIKENVNTTEETRDAQFSVNSYKTTNNYQAINIFKCMCRHILSSGECGRKNTCKYKHDFPSEWIKELQNSSVESILALYDHVKKEKYMFLFKKIFSNITEHLGDNRDFNNLIRMVKDVLEININSDRAPFINNIIIALCKTGVTFHSIVEVVYKNVNVSENLIHLLSDILLNLTVDKGDSNENWTIIKELVKHRNYDIDNGIIQAILIESLEKDSSKKDFLLKIYVDLISKITDSKLCSIFESILNNFYTRLLKYGFSVEANQFFKRCHSLNITLGSKSDHSNSPSSPALCSPIVNVTKVSPFHTTKRVEKISSNINLVSPIHSHISQLPPIVKMVPHRTVKPTVNKKMPWYTPKDQLRIKPIFNPEPGPSTSRLSCTHVPPTFSTPNELFLSAEVMKRAIYEENISIITSLIMKYKDNDMTDIFIKTSVDALLETNHNYPTFFRNLCQTAILNLKDKTLAYVFKTLGLNIILYLTQSKNWNQAYIIYNILRTNFTDDLLNVKIYLPDKYSYLKRTLIIALIHLKKGFFEVSWGMLRDNAFQPKSLCQGETNEEEISFRNNIIEELLKVLRDKKIWRFGLQIIKYLITNNVLGVDMKKYINDILLYALNSKCTINDLREFMACSTNWYHYIADYILRGFICRAVSDKCFDTARDLFSLGCNFDIYTQLFGNEQSLTFPTYYIFEEVFLILDIFFQNMVRFRPIKHKIVIQVQDTPSPHSKPMNELPIAIQQYNMNQATMQVRIINILVNYMKPAMTIRNENNTIVVEPEIVNKHLQGRVNRNLV